MGDIVKRGWNKICRSHKNKKNIMKRIKPGQLFKTKKSFEQNALLWSLNGGISEEYLKTGLIGIIIGYNGDEVEYKVFVDGKIGILIESDINLNI